MHFGQCLTAIKFCDKAIAIDDSFFKSWKLRGECYLVREMDILSCIEITGADDLMLLDVDSSRVERW